MNLFSRFPILVWFLIIALLTSLSISYYSYENIFNKQINETKDSELKRIHQRMSQLQGTINDFNRRYDYNAIHREVSRLSTDPSMDLIAIIDEHKYIRYSSLIEYRDTAMDNHPEINKFILDRNNHNIFGAVELIGDGPMIVGIYPLDDLSHGNKADEYFQSYLYARFDLTKKLNELQYRQQQEISHITVIHFAILFGGILLLYAGMRSRIRSIISGINHFSDGEYNARIGLSGMDEFSKISAGFDAMAEKIQAQNKSLTSLTQQLKERHQELLLQEQDLRVTLDSIGDAVIATDSNGLITRMNPVAQSLTGWRLSEAAGKPIALIFNIVNAGTREVIENPVEKVIKTGQTVYLSNNTTLISRKGVEYQISDSAAPIRNDNNDIQGMVLIFNDVTEQYRLKKTAAKSEQLLRSIMDNSPSVINVKNREGYFTYVNQRFLAVFNLDRDVVAGKRAHDLFSKEIADSMVKYDAQVLRAAGVLEVEETLPHDDGLHCYSSIRFPLRDESGEIYAVCGIATDITERKQQEQLLRRSQKMDALGKLTGGIAHDYNNMLGIVMGYSELMINALEHEPKLQKYAREIHHASQRGVNLTRKLLAFSRPQQTENKLLDINALLNEQKDMLQKVLTARIKLEMQLAKDLWPVWINSSDLEDAIVNMGINAMHAMNNGGKLIIRTENHTLNKTEANQLHLDAGDYVQISIADTGAGMDKETQERMFDPFFTTKGEHGVGLGLSQVYGLIESNRGAITVESELDQGTCITIYLPRYDNTEAEMPETNDDHVEDLNGNKTILVVDDEPGLRSLTTEILSQHGYRVLTANDAKQALDILHSEPVDVLISDIIMPDMDGYELAGIVRNKYPATRIQLVSGFNNKTQHNKSDAYQHENILNKPYSSNDLLMCIKYLD